MNNNIYKIAGSRDGWAILSPSINLDGKEVNEVYIGGFIPFNNPELTQAVVEKAFRQHGYCRARFDGVAARKEDQFNQDYYDFVYTDYIDMEEGIIVKEKDILNNAVIEAPNGMKIPVPPYINTRFAVHVCDAEASVRSIVNQRKAGMKTYSANVDIPTDNTSIVVVDAIDTKPVQYADADNTRLTEAIKNEFDSIISKLQDNPKLADPKYNKLLNLMGAVRDEAVKVALDNKEETVIADGEVKIKEPEVAMTAPIKVNEVPEYKPQDLHMEPFTSVPVLLDLKEVYKKANIKVMFVKHASGIIYAYAYTGKENKFSKKHSLIIDPDGLLLFGAGSAIKFYAYKDSGYIDDADFFMCTDTSFKELLSFLSTTKFVPLKNEQVKKMRQLNKVVEVSTIVGAGHPENYKPSIIDRLLKVYKQLNAYVELNEGARFRFDMASDDISEIRCHMDKDCTKHFGDPGSGPETPLYLTIRTDAEAKTTAEELNVADAA